MDADTIALAFADDWPTVRLVTLQPGHHPRQERIEARPFDCRACFDAGRGFVDHMDGSMCVAPVVDGPF